jgi:hypothetical protein
MFESINTTNELSNFGDELPSLEINKFYIINLQDSDAGNGTHWTVFFYNKPLTRLSD